MTALLEYAGVEVRFGGVRAVDGLDMQVHEGSIHALIGPNGAGKSTALNCVSRFAQPRAGDIRFCGASLLARAPHAIAGLGIGRTFQSLELCGRLSALDNVLIGLSATTPDSSPFWFGRRRRAAEAKAREEAMVLLDLVGLAAQAGMQTNHLAFGQQKRLDIARALGSKPRLLLLDEPAAGLRAREVRELDALLVSLSRQRGITILLVEHVMSLVMAIADRITVLNFGRKLAEGCPSEIRCNTMVVDAYLGQTADAVA
jgi:branched-chain amino acid transport system ATP-binding protein